MNLALESSVSRSEKKREFAAAQFDFSKSHSGACSQKSTLGSEEEEWMHPVAQEWFI